MSPTALTKSPTRSFRLWGISAGKNGERLMLKLSTIPRYIPINPFSKIPSCKASVMIYPSSFSIFHPVGT